MKNKIYEKITEEFEDSQFIRYGENKDLCFYLGRDQDGKYAFELVGGFNPVKIKGSGFIKVEQFRLDNDNFLRFVLDDKDLLEPFCTFCDDMLDATKTLCDADAAYQALKSRYYCWKMLFTPGKSAMTDLEVKGLIGELLFLKDSLIPKYGPEISLNSWTGPENTHKDFSYQNGWYEVKTINAGKEMVHISSIEQLESEIEGHLVVYQLEKMSPTYNGITLNELVDEIISILGAAYLRELFNDKLTMYKFNFGSEKGSDVYMCRGKTVYKVDNKDFPLIHRSLIPRSIAKVQYDILLSDISHFITNDL